MPNDALNCRYMAEELAVLRGGRIDKIFLSGLTVILSVRSEGKTHNLLLSADPSSARVCLTLRSPANPPQPPAFLLHLRKNIGGGIIQNVSVLPYERIFAFDILSHNEIGMKSERVLYVEIMGKYSNIILTENGKITDSLKHITPDISSVRTVLPSLNYVCPPVSEDKIRPDDKANVISLLKTCQKGNVAMALAKALYGLAPATIGAVIKNLGAEPPFDQTDCEKIADALAALYNQKLDPCVTTQNGKTEFFFAPLCGGDYTFYPTLSEAMERVYETNSRSCAANNGLSTIIKNAISRAEKRKLAFCQKAEECKDADKDKLFGELITANIYRIKAGMKDFTTENYYDGALVTIPLDETLSPQANAQAYFKHYSKKKKTAKHLKEQLQATDEELERLDSALQSLKLSGEKEFADVESELVQIGLIKTKKQAKKPSGVSSPLKTEIDGFTVFIGKNNIQNDRLVRSADKKDIWLHTKDIHGSHVIIKSNGKTVPDDVISRAAEHAAYYSKGRQADKVAVDYTAVKNVRKPSSAPPGKVFYTGQKTIMVMPKGLQKS